MRSLRRFLLISLVTSLILEGGNVAWAQCTGQRARTAGSSAARPLSQRLMTGQQNNQGVQQLTTSTTVGTANLQTQQALAILQNDLLAAVSAGQLTLDQANQLAQDVNLVVSSASNPSAAILKLTTDLQTVQQAGTLSPQVAQALTADFNGAVQYAVLGAQNQLGSVRTLRGIR